VRTGRCLRVLLGSSLARVVVTWITKNMTCDSQPRASSAMKLLAHSGMWWFRPKTKAKVRQFEAKRAWKSTLRTDTASSTQLFGNFDCILLEHMVRSTSDGWNSALGYPFVALPCYDQTHAIHISLDVEHEPVGQSARNSSDSSAVPTVSKSFVPRYRWSISWCNYGYLRCTRIVALAAL
jgi:hypothetical protein